jgi:hypothetical protein
MIAFMSFSLVFAVEGRRSEGNKKPRSPFVVSAAPGASDPGGPSVVVVTRRQSPGTRASRQGRLSFFFASVVKSIWRIGGIVAHIREECKWYSHRRITGAHETG